MRKRFVYLLLALGLVITGFAGILGPAAADHEVDDYAYWIFYPWVANGETLDGQGPHTGVVTIQNLEPERVRVSFHSHTAASSDHTITLEPWASRTLAASTVGVGSPGGPLVVQATWADAELSDLCQIEEEEVDEETEEHVICIRAPRIAGVEKQAAPDPTTTATTSSSHETVDGYTAIPLEDVPWGPASQFCAEPGTGGLNEGCTNIGANIIGIPLTFFDGHSYLPIVQTNNNWNSHLHISNIDGSSPDSAAVTVRLFESGGQAAGGPSVVENFSVSKGETAVLDVEALLASHGITDEFVGSAWITSDYGMVTNVSRVKAETDMMLTNTAAPSLLETGNEVNGGFNGEVGVQHVGTPGLFEMYAPLVFKDYNGWNTGISVVNTSEFHNQIQIEFHGPTGNVVHAESLAIPPKGMEFVYMRRTQDLGLNDGFVGSAVLTSILPFHASVDEVKYDGVGPDVGQAMSYITTAAGAKAQFLDGGDQISVFGHDEPPAPAGNLSLLALPLVQKGNSATGLGDTSGIQLFNGDSSDPISSLVWFFDPPGNLAPPTSTDLTAVQTTLGPLQNATLYTMNYGAMSTGFQGSAIVLPIEGGGQVYGVSNNVNYAVDGDGSSAFNMVNSFGQFRNWMGAEPVGTTLFLEPETAELLVFESHTVTATLLDQFGNPMEGETIEFLAEHSDPSESDETAFPSTDASGQASMTWSRSLPGTDSITATHTASGVQDTATAVWTAEIALTHGDDQDDPAVNPVGETHEFVATVTGAGGAPVPNVEIEFVITGDLESEADATTDGDGEASVFVTLAQPGEVQVFARIVADGTESNTLTKTWEVREATTLELTAGDEYDHPESADWDGIDLTATVFDQFGDVMENETVTFERTDVIVADDPNFSGQFYDGGNLPGGNLQGASMTDDTDVNGEAFATYVSDRVADGRPLRVEITATANGASDSLEIEFADAV